MIRAAALLVTGLLALTGCTPAESPAPPSSPPTGEAVTPEPWLPEPAVGPVEVESPEYAQILEDAQAAVETELGHVEWEPPHSRQVDGVCGATLGVRGSTESPEETELDALSAVVETAIAEHGFEPFHDSWATAGGKWVTIADRADTARFELSLQSQVGLLVYVPLALEQCPGVAAA